MNAIIHSVTVITHIFVIQFTTIQMISFYYDIEITLKSVCTNLAHISM